MCSCVDDGTGAVVQQWHCAAVLKLTMPCVLALISKYRGLSFGPIDKNYCGSKVLLSPCDVCLLTLYDASADSSSCSCNDTARRFRVGTCLQAIADLTSAVGAGRWVHLFPEGRIWQEVCSLC